MNKIFEFLPNKVEAFLLSTEDELLTEYTLECNKRLQFLTGFTGSLAFALIKKEGKNLIFVDGRYTTQAKQEVDESFEIHPLKDFAEHLKGIYFALNGKHHSYKFVQSLKEKGFNFEIILECPVDKIWKREINVSRETFNFELAEFSKEQKIEKVLSHLTEKGADAIFISNPHDVCYLFNIRGNYLENSPIVPCFGIVSRETSKIIFPEEVQNLKLGKVLVSSEASYFIYSTLSQNNTVIKDVANFLETQKAVKTDYELECIKKAHIEDGKALKEFASWLKSADLKNETEYTIGEKLLEFRKKQKGFVCESFPAIVGFKENGAIVHYRAKKETAKQINENGILLIDSGGQYYNKELGIAGTTDVTRVFAIGSPSQDEKRAYTLVLKGHIALACAVFPVGTTGAMLDVLARQFLWKEGKNYNHGTGHGVGYYLSVHEGGCGISANYNQKLMAGMIVSNEPGFYEENKFGVRFENLMFVKNSKIEGFLEFEILTKFGVEPLLLDYDILTDSELEWLTNYTTFSNS